MERRVTKPYVVDGITLVSVKDYDVDYCIKNKEVLHIKYLDGVMTMDPDSLVSKEVMRSGFFKSKTGGQDYRLVSYKWEPNISNDD
jgi:hypothetical protein